MYMCYTNMHKVGSTPEEEKLIFFLEESVTDYMCIGCPDSGIQRLWIPSKFQTSPGHVGPLIQNIRSYENHTVIISQNFI